MFLIMITFRVS